MSLPSILATGTRTPRRILAAELFAFSSQKRAASRSRMAPNTRWKDRRKTPIVRTHEEKAEMDMLRQRRDNVVAKLGKLQERQLPLSADERAFYAQTTKEAGILMTSDQARFMHSWLRGIQDSHDAAQEFKSTLELMQSYSSFSLDDIYDLTFILRNKGAVGCARAGRELIKLCSEHGHAEATIQVVGSCLRQDATKPGVLRSRTAMFALERLRTISKSGNVRAIVMEANVARHNNLIEQATALYNRALEILVDDDPFITQDKYAKIKDELSSPWIELAYLHVTRGENVKAMKAYMVGLERDDPMAYFNLARLDFYMAGNQYTHDWLYNMTKAAASGHYKAAHELGEYYANSPATPPQTPKTSFMDKLQGFASYFNSPNINLDPKTNIHHHDAFGKTPKMRIDLAQEWLQRACSNHYLPANITLAQLYLQKFIYPKGTLLAPLDPYGHSTDPNAIPNHLFNPGKAQARLTEVLTACLQISEAKSVSKTNAEYLTRARPWSQHEEVLEVIESAESLNELREQAELIADAAGLDIKSTNLLPPGIPHLGFMRFHKGVRGQGLWEADEKEWLVVEDEQQAEKRV